MGQFQVTATTRDEYGRWGERSMTVDDEKWLVVTGSDFSSEEHWDEWYNEKQKLCSHTRARKFSVVGPAPEQTVLGGQHQRNDGHGWAISSRSQTVVLAGDQPFGVISERHEDGQPIGGLYFTCARQVHKGELGRRPKIARPQFAREAPRSVQDISGYTGKPVKARNKRRGKIGWARLTDVARMVELPPEEVVRRFFRFTHAEEPALHALLAEDRDQIHSQKIEYNSWEVFHWENLPALFDRSPETIWVRKGWVMVVLYLHHFGHIPNLPTGDSYIA
jgi:hypothetical protein